MSKNDCRMVVLQLIVADLYHAFKHTEDIKYLSGYLLLQIELTVLAPPPV